MPHTYKSICFDCRKVVHRAYGAWPKCPICARPMLSAGPDFRAPKKNDDRAWKETRKHIAQLNRPRYGWQEAARMREANRLRDCRPTI